MDSIARIVGFVEMPDRGKTSRPRSPERIQLAHEVLSLLEPGKALAVECPSREELQTVRCHLLVMGKSNLATRSRGLTLYVYLKAKQLVMGEVLND